MLVRPRIFAAAFLLTLLALATAHAQAGSPPLCQYKTFTDVRLFSEPDNNSSVVGKVPSGKTLQATAKKSYWAKVEYKGVVGWAATTAMSRVEGCPKVPYLEFESIGYKIIGDVHRNFFSLYNAGTAPYTGKITVGVFSGERMLNEVEADFVARSVVEGGGRTFYIDTYSKAERYEFKAGDDKRTGQIGKFIERID